MPIINCPKCGKGLQLPDEYAGQVVQCPHCQQTFNASAEAASPPLATPPPAPKPRASREYEDEPERPARRSRRDYDDDDFEDDRGRSRRSEVPHRGATILVLGILSVVCCGIFTGIPAWIMGSGDLRAMAEGRMDRSGEGMTRAGQIIGIVGTILGIISVIWVLAAFAGGGARFLR
jgi:hypothetical protein